MAQAHGAAVTLQWHICRLNRNCYRGIGRFSHNTLCTKSPGCIANYPVTVNVTPVAITGTMNVCSLATASLGDITPGGTWSSVTTSCRHHYSSTGHFFWCCSRYFCYFLHNWATGCFALTVITVNALPPVPATISGIASVCAGGATNLVERYYNRRGVEQYQHGQRYHWHGR